MALQEQITLNQRFEVLMILSSTTHTIEFAGMYKSSPVQISQLLCP